MAFSRVSTKYDTGNYEKHNAFTFRVEILLQPCRCMENCALYLNAPVTGRVNLIAKRNVFLMEKIYSALV